MSEFFPHEMRIRFFLHKKISVIFHQIQPKFLVVNCKDIITTKTYFVLHLSGLSIKFGNRNKKNVYPPPKIDNNMWL